MDTKAIEEKAINELKRFIEDSTVISQYINEDDKEPCWDGHLYLYSGGKRDKEHLIGRVPVQVKGEVVKRIQTVKWKYTLSKEDLHAYLHEPTLFIVCQIVENTKERKLFYRELLPTTVKELLHGMGKHKTRKTQFHPLTDNLNEFENQVKIFYQNSKRMVSFADNELITLEDVFQMEASKRYTLSIPVIGKDRLGQMKFLSTHDNQLYARIDDKWKIDIPIEGTARLAFKKDIKEDVSIGDRVFYNGYKNEIVNGRMVITIGDTLILNMPMDSNDVTPPAISLRNTAKTLKESILQAEFVIALHENGVLKVGDRSLLLKVNGTAPIEEIKNTLKNDKAFQDVLDKLHVEKDLLLEGITAQQERDAYCLIETIGKGNVVKIPDIKSSIYIMEISNLTLLLWCSVDERGDCALGDFFDGSVNMKFKFDGKHTTKASPYSYLKYDNLWEKVDNIDYSGLITSAAEMAKENEEGFIMTNYDVLAMISASDAVEQSDKSKSERLLVEAAKLNKWLSENDSHKELRIVHIVNAMQIIKRQRAFTDEESAEMRSMLESSDTDNSLKAALALLLEKHEEFDMFYSKMSKKEQDLMRKYPIWKFS